MIVFTNPFLFLWSECGGEFVMLENEALSTEEDTIEDMIIGETGGGVVSTEDDENDVRFTSSMCIDSSAIFTIFFNFLHVFMCGV